MKINIGIIVDDVIVSKQVQDFIIQSLESDIYKIKCIFVQKSDYQNSNLIGKISSYIINKGALKLIANLFFKSICKFESVLLKNFSKYPKFYETFNIVSTNINIIDLHPIISKSGIVYRYSDEDINIIKSQNLNLLVRAGSGILRGDILTVCENGVISFHHADNNINRGGPPGFWEVLNEESKTGFVIQRLKEELDGGDILYKGFITTHWIYSFNLAKLYEASNPFLHEVIEKLALNDSDLKIYPKIPYSFPLYKTPNSLQLLKYLFKVANKIFTKLFRKITRRGYRWSVAYQFTDSWEDVVLWKSKKIPNPPNRFLADPFVVKNQENYYCFLEDYDYKKAKGSISVYQINKNECKELGVSLEEDFHLSYPFIFKYDNNFFMCPETGQANEIRLYKCEDFPLKWKLEKILMKNVNAVDTNIFYKNGLWWLMTNIATSYAGDHESELHIFYNENLISSEWIPHKSNPVMFNPDFARNGGLLKKDDELYRVYQRQGFDMYGKGLGVAQIKSITADNYKEKKIFELGPDFEKNLEGIHTYNFDEGILVFDYLKISNFTKLN